MSANTPPELPSGNQPPQNQSGFNVPPAGQQPPPLPQEQSHQYPGQKPGYVQEPPKPTQQPVQGQVPGQQAAAPGLDLAAILQAALAGQKPAEPPVQAAKPNWVPGSINEFNVDSIEDPIIKSMASVLKVAGKDLDLNRVLGNALAFGDPNLVDVAYISEKGGANAQQLTEIAKGIVQAVEAKSAAIMSEVHALAGGEAQWAQSTAVFNKVAPQELRITVASMLDSTNPAFIKAGAKIVAEFGRSSGQLPQVGSNLLTGASAGLGAAQGLTAAQFKIEQFKLDPQAPGFKEAREALFARRALGKRAGL